jgi:hypothetical protein
MHVSCSTLIFVLAFLTSALVSAAQPTPRPQEVFAPYWTAEPGWETELQLKNNLATGSLTVTPVLLIADGTEFPLEPVVIASNAAVSVALNRALLTSAPSLLNHPGAFGSVAFRFAGFDGRNLHAVVSIHRQSEPIGFDFTAFPPLNSERAGSREGIWWQPRRGVKDALVISNSSEKTVRGMLWLSDAAGKRWSHALALDPHQTRRMAVGDLVRKAGLSGKFGGITFEVPAAAPALDSVHFLYEERTGFSAQMKMFGRNPSANIEERTGSAKLVGSRQWTLWAPMLALSTPDPAADFPAGTMLQPTIFVRNTTAQPVRASITLSWRGDTGEGQATLPQLNLAPYETRQIEVDLMQKQLGIPADAHWALVTLSTPAAPDSLMAVAASYDSTGRYGMQTPFADVLGDHFVGGEWRADATHNALAAVTNGGAHPVDALLTLHYDSGNQKYEMQQTIQPGAQMWLNFADLIHHRVADRKGRVLPADLTSATYDVQELTAGPGSLLEASLLVDNTWGHHLLPPSASCCATVAGSPVFDPATVDLLLQAGADPLYVEGIDSCKNQPKNISLEFVDWWTLIPHIATMTTEKVTPVSGGSTTGYAKGLVYEGQGVDCGNVPVQVEVPITVQQPDHLSVLTDTQATKNCSPNPDSRERDITYEVVDATDTRMQTPFLLKENVPTNVVNSCNSQIVHVGATCTSNVNYFPGGLGEFTDFLIPGCPSSPQNSPCGFKFANQQWQWCPAVGQPTSIGTIGADNVENTIIDIDGNITGFTPGTTFPK